MWVDVVASAWSPLLRRRSVERRRGGTEDATLDSGKPGRRSRVPKGANRMPGDSTFYEKVVPALLIGLGALTVILILIALGVLLGIVKF